MLCTFHTQSGALWQRQPRTLISQPAIWIIPDQQRAIQIGIRGGLTDIDIWKFSHDSGMRVVYMEEFYERGVKWAIGEARRVVGDGPAYVSFDVDGLDPVFAPGTGTPEIGGFSSHEAQRLVRGLAGIGLADGRGSRRRERAAGGADRLDRGAGAHGRSGRRRRGSRSSAARPRRSVPRCRPRPGRAAGHRGCRHRSRHPRRRAAAVADRVPSLPTESRRLEEDSRRCPSRRPRRAVRFQESLRQKQGW